MDMENTEPIRPKVWIIDTEHEGLESARAVLADWAEPVYYPYPTRPGNDASLPDAILFSAEMKGGADGVHFTELAALAANVPLIAVSRLRSLAQAVAYFRAGAADYLSFPLDENELRERIAAAVERAANAHMHGVMVELEAVDPDPGVIQLRLSASPQDEQVPEEMANTDADTEPAVEPRLEDEDILAQISSPDHDNTTLDSRNQSDQILVDETQDTEPTKNRDGTIPDSEPIAPAEAEISDLTDIQAGYGEEEPNVTADDAEEPEIVDGLPIPTLWEELPCGLLVYDSSGNLVFSNQLGLELFGSSSLADLQDALENRRSDFRAYGASHHPVAENHWPQEMAWKTGTPRSAVLSVELPNRRRSWLRIDCLPHLNDGAITRLSMTVVNLTGELPPLVIANSDADSSAANVTALPKKNRAKRRGKKHRKG